MGLTPVLLVFFGILTLSSSQIMDHSINTKNYILDDRFPIVYTLDSFGFTHFGESVTLSQGPPTDYSDRPTAWMFIGAPTSNTTGKGFQSGVIWRCSIGREITSGLPQKNRICKVVDIDPTSKSRGPGSPVIEGHTNMWAGGSIEVKNGRMVTCGHRWSRGGKTYFNGLCYFLLQNTTTKKESFLDEDGPSPLGYSHRLLPFFVPEPADKNNLDQHFTFIDGEGKNETGHEWGVGQLGISLHIMTNKSGGQELLLGAPGVRMWSGAVVRYIDNPSITKGPNFRRNRNQNSPIYSEFVVGYRESILTDNSNHWFEYFGYAVSSGKFFNEEDVYYVGGAPRGGGLLGEVVIFQIADPDRRVGPLSEGIYKRQITQVLSISPPVDAFGSYFGSVVYATDIDGDGLDELLVGAPSYGFFKPIHATPDQQWYGDQGCVFIYYFNSAKRIKREAIVQSNTHDAGAKFGSAISHLRWKNQKTNKYETYIVIGSPYENQDQGAVYIFNKDLKLVQKINPQDLDFLGRLRGFGSSISLPLDVDENDTPDLAIGAYKSSQVVVLRTRPTVLLTGSISFVDPSRSKLRDKKVSATSDLLHINSCVNVFLESGIVQELDVSVSLYFEKRLILQKKTSANSKYIPSHEYSEKFRSIQFGEDPICRVFDVLIDRSIADPKLKKVSPYEVTQTVWYDATAKNGTVPDPPLEYTIKENGIAEQIGGAAMFQDLRPTRPYPVAKFSKLFFAEIAPNDCMASKCNPDLQFTAQWIDPETSQPLKSSTVVLGTMDEIVFKLQIINDKETAITPSFTIEWPKIGVVLSERRVEGKPEVFLLQKENCKENHQETKLVYNCIFPDDITKNAPEILEIPLNLRETYATSELKEFTMAYSIKPKESLQSIKTTGSSTIILSSNSTLSLTGSKKNDTLRSPEEYECKERAVEGQPPIRRTLYSAWKQSYWVSSKGSSGLSVNINLVFPFGRKATNIVRPFILTTPSKDNTYCKAETIDDHFYSIDTPSSPDGEYPQAEVGAPKRGGESIVSLIYRSKRDADAVVDETGTVKAPAAAAPLPLFEPSDTLSIKCDINGQSSNPDFTCVRIDCFVNVPGDSAVELGFDMFMVKDELDPLIEKFKYKEIIVESSGNASIYSGTVTREDVAYTRLREAIIPVQDWVYFTAALCGILIMILIAIILYKCGFFKRKTKQKLELLKEEHRRKSSLMIPPNFIVRDVDSTAEDQRLRKPSLIAPQFAIREEEYVAEESIAESKDDSEDLQAYLE